MGNLELRRKDEVREKKLDTRSILEGKVTGRDFYNGLRLPGSGVAGHVEGVFDTRNHKKPQIVKRRRFIPYLEWHFDEDRFHSGERYPQVAAVPVVFQVTFGKGQGREEAKVEVLSDFQIGHNAQVEPRSIKCFHHIDAVRLQEFRRAESPEGRIVVSEGDAEVIWFLLEFEEVVIIVRLKVLPGQKAVPRHPNKKGKYYFLPV